MINKTNKYNYWQTGLSINPDLFYFMAVFIILSMKQRNTFNIIWHLNTVFTFKNYFNETKEQWNILALTHTLLKSNHMCRFHALLLSTSQIIISSQIIYPILLVKKELTSREIVYSTQFGLVLNSASKGI